jgi:CRP-like cAMP-binding protein
LLTGEPRAANITAETSVLTLAMNRNNFHKYMGDLQAMMDFEAKLQSLKSLPIFAMSDLTQLELERLAEQTIEVSYREGTKLTELGSSTENLWMIRSGKLLLYGGESGKVYNLEAGDTFGEQYILHDDEFIRTHYAVCEQNLTTWVLNRDQIESIIVDISRLGEEAGHLEGNKMATVKRRDIKMFRVLGEGAFGKVWLATNIFTNVPYAVKVIKKQRVLLMKQEKNVLREKDFLASLQHPFILGMVSSFQDPSDLYIVMPLVQGGELFSIVSSRLAKAETLSNIEAAFYLGCVAEALGHFHHRYIAYRDLKLENIMIDSDGYVKVVDLGFAKMVPDKSTSFPICHFSHACLIYNTFLFQRLHSVVLQTILLQKSSCQRGIIIRLTTGP